jgi:hypothetical protein
MIGMKQWLELNPLICDEDKEIIIKSYTSLFRYIEGRDMAYDRDSHAEQYLVDENNGEIIILDIEERGFNALHFDLAKLLERMSLFTNDEEGDKKRSEVIREYITSFNANVLKERRIDDYEKFMLKYWNAVIIKAINFHGWSSIKPEYKDRRRGFLRNAAHAIDHILTEFKDGYIEEERDQYKKLKETLMRIEKTPEIVMFLEKIKDNERKTYPRCPYEPAETVLNDDRIIGFIGIGLKEILSDNIISDEKKEETIKRAVRCLGEMNMDTWHQSRSKKTELQINRDIEKLRILEPTQKKCAERFIIENQNRQEVGYMIERIGAYEFGWMEYGGIIFPMGICSGEDPPLVELARLVENGYMRRIEKKDRFRTELFGEYIEALKNSNMPQDIKSYEFMREYDRSILKACISLVVCKELRGRAGGDPRHLYDSGIEAAERLGEKDMKEVMQTIRWFAG